MPTTDAADHAAELAFIRLSALRKLHTLMLNADTPAEARRCATAILKCPVLKGIDDISPSPGAVVESRSVDSTTIPHADSTARPAVVDAKPSTTPPAPSAVIAPGPRPDHAQLVTTLTRAVRQLDPARRTRHQRPAADLRARAGAAPP